MAKMKTLHKIGIGSAIALASLLFFVYFNYDNQAPKYNYSFDGREGKAPRSALGGDKDFHQIPVYILNKGVTDGNISLTISAVNATFTGTNGIGSWPNIPFLQPATVGDGWKGYDVYVRPYPGVNQFTLSLTANRQQDLSDYAGAVPTQITYKLHPDTSWRLQPY